ncbi:MAG: hypothetical protein KJ646_01290 [Nanoarchaeota archaeon]|nr:hypothetical protein [Nanoarchaeota archaeon]
MKLNNEEKVVLRILKNCSVEYNANSISKVLGLTPMGSLKLLRRLEEQKIIILRRVSNIKFYNFNFENQYAKDYVSLILRKEADNCSAFVKRWVGEIRKIGIAEGAIIFGSVLRDDKSARDIDVLFVVDKKNFGRLRKKIEKINTISEKKIHPVYQSGKDLLKNLKNRDKVVLEIIRGLVVSGEKKFVDLLEVAR